MRRNKKVFTYVPNPIEDTSAPPRLPVHPSVINHIIRPPVIGLPEVGVPYVEPVDVAPPPLFRTPIATPVSIATPNVLSAEEPVLTPAGERVLCGVMPRNKIVIPHVPNPIEDTSVPPRLPIHPSVISHTIHPPVIGLPEVGVPYVEPIDVAPEPLFRMPLATSFSMATPSVLSVEEPVLSVGEAEVVMSGIFPCITNAAQNPIYAPFSAIATLCSQFITISEEISTINSNIIILSNELTDLSDYVYSNAAISDWSTFPAVSTLNMSGNTIINSTSIEIDGQFLTADASDLLLNGIPVATITDISNVEDWALFPAVGNVNMAGFDISQAGTISLSGGGVIFNDSNVMTINANALTVNTVGAVNFTAEDVNINSTSAVRQMDIQSAGSMLLTSAIALNMATGAESSWNLGGLLLVNVGVGMNVLGIGFVNFTVGGAVSIAVGGVINLGSGVYTTIEHLKIDDSVISRYNDTNNNITISNVAKITGDQGGAGPTGFLTIEGQAVDLLLKTTEGIILTASGLDISGSPQISMRTSTLDNRSYPVDFNFDIKSPDYYLFSTRNNDPAPEITRPAVTLRLASSAISNGSNFMTLTYDANTTLALNCSAGNVNLTGVEQLSAVSANINSAILTSSAGGSVLLLNGVPLTTISSSDASNWAQYSANHYVNMNGNFITAGSSNDLSMYGVNIHLDPQSNLFVHSFMNMLGNPILNTIGVEICGNTQTIDLTASGSSLLVDGQPVYTGALPPDNASNWATYSANHYVNMNGNFITAGSSNDLSMYGVNIHLDPQSNLFVHSFMNMLGNPILNTIGVEICGNTQTIDLTASGSQLLVQGQPVFTGALPPNEDWANYPAVATVNLSGNAITSGAGSSIAINASSSVILQHGTGATNNGIYLQNSAGVGGVKLVFTGAGTLYNADEVQSSDIVTPNGCRFYNGVYNPSGGSPPLIPVEYGRAVVDVVTKSAYFANLTSGSIPAANRNTNSVFIGNLPHLTTTAAASTIAIGDISSMTGQQTGSIAIGLTCGLSGLGANSIAIGSYASSNGGSFSNTIVLNATGAALNPTQANSTFISPMRNISDAGFQLLARNSTTGEVIQTLITAISGDAVSNWSTYHAVSAVDMSGFSISNVNVGTFSNIVLNANEIALGAGAGAGQGLLSTAVGAVAGVSQGGNSVAIGYSAGSNQGLDCVAVGAGAGTSQAQYSVAVGELAGVSQGSGAIAIGYTAAQTGQLQGAISIGYQAGLTGQQGSAIGIGFNAANSGQGNASVAIGLASAFQNQSSNCVAIGNESASNAQQAGAVCIGWEAGQESQGTRSVAIGAGSGFDTMGADSVSVGAASGQSNMGAFSVAIGASAGNSGLASNAVVVGADSGLTTTGAGCVGIGYSAGRTGLGSNSVAIGSYASYAGGGFSNTLVINATGVSLEPAQANSCYVAPVRATPNSNAYQSSLTLYNSTTKEVSYSSSAYSLQVIATSGTTIQLTPNDRGKVIILTGTTTQDFSGAALGASDTNFYVSVRNGNAVNGGDITITGATGNLTIHETKSTQNGGQVYLVWNGTALVAY